MTRITPLRGVLRRITAGTLWLLRTCWRNTWATDFLRSETLLVSNDVLPASDCTGALKAPYCTPISFRIGGYTGLMGHGLSKHGVERQLVGLQLH